MWGKRKRHTAIFLAEDLFEGYDVLNAFGPCLTFECEKGVFAFCDWGQLEEIAGHDELVEEMSAVLGRRGGRNAPEFHQRGVRSSSVIGLQE